MIRVLRFFSALLAGASLVGCDYGNGTTVTNMNMNTCASTSDCSAGGSCRDGLCVANSSDPLNVMLRVIPQRLRGNDPALPILLDRSGFTLHPSSSPSFKLVGMATVATTITRDQQAIPAQITFTPINTIPGIDSDIVTANLTGDKFNNSIQVLDDVQYRVVVRPNDSTLTPFRTQLHAGFNAPLGVDYPLMNEKEVALNISGVPTDRQLVLRAFDADTGDPVSASLPITSDRQITLKLSPDPDPSSPVSYRLDLRASPSAMTNTVTVSTASPCDTSAAAFPVLTLEGDGLMPTNNVVQVIIPQLPPRVRYEGTVELCPEAKDTKPETLGKVPVVLHSQPLSLDPLTRMKAAFDATTDATYDPDSGKFRFCVQVLPGTYDVLASPPPNSGCALFAAQRLIQAPDGTDTASGTELQLPSPARLESTVRTDGLLPVAGASVAAIALGRSSAENRIELLSERVTTYNRSEQTTTDASGAFRLPLDLGSYDVVIKPPAASGFPWRLSHDVNVGPGVNAGTPLTTPITMSVPVAVNGTFTATFNRDDPQPEGAHVDAYALIPDGSAQDPTCSGDKPACRAIQIGSATADDAGHFTLLLPSSTEDIRW